MPRPPRTRCPCGTFITSGCKKCGNKPAANHEQVVTGVRTWAERQRALGLVNAFEWAVLDRMLDDVFGERL